MNYSLAELESLTITQLKDIARRHGLVYQQYRVRTKNLLAQAIYDHQARHPNVACADNNCPRPASPCKKACPRPASPCKPACPRPASPCKVACPRPASPCKPACARPASPCARPASPCARPASPCKTACPPVSPCASAMACPLTPPPCASASASALMLASPAGYRSSRRSVRPVASARGYSMSPVDDAFLPPTAEYPALTLPVLSNNSSRASMYSQLSEL